MALSLITRVCPIKEMTESGGSVCKASNGVCKVTQKHLEMRPGQLMGPDRTWSELDSLLTGNQCFVLIKGDVGSAVKAIQSFQKEHEEVGTERRPLRRPTLVHRPTSKASVELPSKDVLMPDARCEFNAVTHPTGRGHHNEVPLRSRRGHFKQHAESDASLSRSLFPDFSSPTCLLISTMNQPKPTTILESLKTLSLP